MTSAYESHIDRQIREAQERGDFDDLPGLGKPLPDRGERYDENWWVKELIRRENLTGLAPGTLRLRKEVEEVAQTAAAKKSEWAVRELVSQLNERIASARQGLVDGPTVSYQDLDVVAVVRAWHAAREQEARERPPTPPAG
ncbi:hypothetical protein F4553_001366 [Allocatelliglobosispora scoriae]|uniref:DnaJ homologue subfamily C member 28 conserved domain-containing protein n=1 Tax=Allocatelliglobosispora scoriae TaxID=643052 RepID=A0A841BFX1_9ACTN|nr:DUF1992 domain-containing protein [Allocatelliglobosispora scoriae]MBB5867987.1 hypothetical protein [Allocatelliglobosispora scoriae]